MRYIIRAVKYFIRVSIFFGAILLALMLSGLVSKDVNVAFQNGWQSIGWIAVMFAAVSAAYPFFGYTSRRIPLLGDQAEYRGQIEEAFRERGYVPSGEGRFRLASPLARAFRLWEDAITVTTPLGYLEVEGLGRDLVRVVSSLERHLKNNE
jgi:hypothetical protein